MFTRTISFYFDLLLQQLEDKASKIKALFRQCVSKEIKGDQSRLASCASCKLRSILAPMKNVSGSKIYCSTLSMLPLINIYARQMRWPNRPTIVFQGAECKRYFALLRQVVSFITETFQLSALIFLLKVLFHFKGFNYLQMLAPTYIQSINNQLLCFCVVGDRMVPNLPKGSSI